MPATSKGSKKTPIDNAPRMVNAARAPTIAHPANHTQGERGDGPGTYRGRSERTAWGTAASVATEVT